MDGQACQNCEAWKREADQATAETETARLLRATHATEWREIEAKTEKEASACERAMLVLMGVLSGTALADTPAGEEAMTLAREAAALRNKGR
jgi:hypothetical protein